VSDHAIVTDTGAEVITGSTRLKAGTAHKMVMNMLTTCAMVKTGRVYENMMVNLKPYNIKLRQRVINIVCDICHCEAEKAVELLDATDWEIRSAAELYRKENV
jgi:N-acetylmuramic acid 6-phosphate etherase